MRYRYTVELTVDELDFSATEAEHLRAALREAAEEYATGEVKVLCEDGWCIEKNDARIRAAEHDERGAGRCLTHGCGRGKPLWVYCWASSSSMGCGGSSTRCRACGTGWRIGGSSAGTGKRSAGCGAHTGASLRTACKKQTWALWYGGGRAAKSTHQWKRPK